MAEATFTPAFLEAQAAELIRQFGYPEHRPDGTVARAAYAPLYDAQTTRPVRRYILQESLPSGELRLLQEDGQTREVTTLWIFGSTHADSWRNIQTAAGLNHIQQANEELQARNNQLAASGKPPLRYSR